MLDILFRSKDVEKAGTGFQRVNELCNKFNISWTFRKEAFGFFFEFIRTNVHLNVQINIELIEQEQLIYNLLDSNIGISKAELALRIGKSEKTIQRIVNDLIEKKVIVRVDSNKNRLMGSFKVIRKNIANVVTITRIVISLSMIFFEVVSVPFMVLYLVAALSDVLDGFIARKMNIQSKLGSKLDTIADIVFFVVLISKICGLLHLPLWEIVGLGIIVLIKIFSIIINYIRAHSFIVDVHSNMNKLTGLLLFFLPISIDLSMDKYYICFLLIFALIAATDEMMKVIKHFIKNNTDIIIS